jgi:hypothetical protein
MGIQRHFAKHFLGGGLRFESLKRHVLAEDFLVYRSKRTMIFGQQATVLIRSLRLSVCGD